MTLSVLYREERVKRGKQDVREKIGIQNLTIDQILFTTNKNDVLYSLQ